MLKARSLGFHPYLGLPNIPRAKWQLKMPAMRRLLLNGIPTGAIEPFATFDAAIGESIFDDCFVVKDRDASFSLLGGGIRITLQFLEGYSFAQIFAPKGKDFIALEPMTAPTNALSSGRGLRIIEPRNEFRAAFRISVHAFPIVADAQ